MTLKPNSESKILTTAFNEALNGFKNLKNKNIKLVIKKIPKTSMRAQPIINRYFLRKSTREFKVEVAHVCKIDNKLLMEELPHQILVGWFAHELGHIQDYQRLNVWGIIKLAILYLISGKYKKGVERRADLEAVKNGFANEIIATKRYLLAHADLSPRYKRNLTKHYYSPEEIQELVNQESS